MDNSLFINPLSTLGTYIIPFEVVNKKWRCDKHYPESAIQRFIRLNTESLKYLGITVEGIFYEGKFALQLTTSNYVGCVPTYSPINGKASGDLMVIGRFNEDISELLSITGDSILPEFNNDLPLSSGEIVKPPLYFECINFIDKYIEAQNKGWRKFTNVVKVQKFPTASTMWNKYALTSTHPSKAQEYHNKCNVLSNEHPEWHKLNYVLNIVINELESIRTPLRARMAYQNKINKLKNSYSKTSIQFTNKIQIHMADPGVIKELKTIANLILKDSANRKYAWRLDFAVFFERYIQFLLHSVAIAKGAKEINNPHYDIRGIKQPKWCLKYLEPDIVIQKEEEQYIIDAKYKSHMYNSHNDTEQLRESFRADLHQVLAYCSFNCMTEKKALLIYPSAQFTVFPINIKNHFNGLTNKVAMIGIPLLKSEVSNIKKELQKIIQFK